MKSIPEGFEYSDAAESAFQARANKSIKKLQKMMDADPNLKESVQAIIDKAESQGTNKIKVIFLDCDGVLNSIKFMQYCYDNGIDPDDRIDPKAVALLNELVKNTGAKIVISSCWRLPFVDDNNLDGLKDILVTKNGISDNIIGMTPDGFVTNCRKIRGDEIQQWLDDCGYEIESFVIIDDDSDMSHLWKFLVKTSVQTGLQRQHIIDAEIILNKGIHK